MSQWFRWGCVALAACAVVFGLSQRPAAAAAAPAPQVAVLDMDAVTRQYDGYKKAMDRLNGFAKEREAVFSTLQTGLGLSREEYEEYTRLAANKVKVNPDRIKQLEELAKKNMADYTALKDKENPTDEEKARLEKLDEQIKTVSAQINERGTALSQEIQNEYTRYTEMLTKLVDAGIGKVAQAKKCSIVLSRDLVTREGKEKFVLWGGTDITDDVVKQLNAEFKESMLEQK